jgi:SAM-dependent methyltransferase
MWYETLKEIGRLLEPVSDTELRERWNVFSANVSASEPPYHLNAILAELGATGDRRERSDIAILDHGCGPGSTLIWLAALGYTNVRGVDVGGKLSAQNRLARVCWGKTTDPFVVYDGGRLPFEDRAFDLIISQQVLEHVPEAQLVSYYSEEGRVLKPGGRALHQVPHRLIPYDSHTRTWMLHLLPKKLSSHAMHAIGNEWPDHLHLRWPWVHLRMARKHIGPCELLTRSRLKQLQVFDYYDGPSTPRRMLARLCALPVAGPVFAWLATWGVSLETRATRVP